MSGPKRGWRHSTKSRSLMSQAKRNKFIGENNPMYGRRHSDRTKKLMSESKIGRVWIHQKSREMLIRSSETESYTMAGWNIGRKKR